MSVKQRWPVHVNLLVEITRIKCGLYPELKHPSLGITNCSSVSTAVANCSSVTTSVGMPEY